ncbi:MAG: hypothetical protein A2X42_03360 [Candidatus Margulisbacteria bacterium GWF2_38_17]|nr:MAG: hypothetical protein A2X43_10715 [Candidatus Margulisbacteria bacterium GWD2_39_127]OGI03391.1 MAG: hypothetical protein A2X42_03360 [Candidatus Margulisbacteria bacterium GWF2_38_17]OGI06575.1 MAG: hypothetical protein A2X41_00520 [Candidatus Margulisbacteria bacterium GWE2_39_32]
MIQQSKPILEANSFGAASTFCLAILNNDKINLLILANGLVPIFAALIKKSIRINKIIAGYNVTMYSKVHAKIKRAVSLIQLLSTGTPEMGQ